MKNIMLICAVLSFFAITFTTNASACNFGANDLDFLDGHGATEQLLPLTTLTGSVEVIYLGYEAANTNTLEDDSGVVWTNNVTNVGTKTNIIFQTAFFNDTSDSDPANALLTGKEDLRIYEISGANLKSATGEDWFDVGYNYMGPNLPLSEEKTYCPRNCTKSKAGP